MILPTHLLLKLKLLQVAAMEQGRQKMLEKWAEPPWGKQHDLLQVEIQAVRPFSVAVFKYLQFQIRIQIYFSILIF